MHNTLELLLLDQSDQQLEALIASIRDSGQAVHTHFILDLEDLEEALERQQWDLCCATTHPENSIDRATLLALFRTHTDDLPAVLLYSSADQSETSSTTPQTDPIDQALTDGFVDAAPVEQHGRIGKILKREFSNLQARRMNRNAESKLGESEQRCQLLLQSSGDGIAYIHEGMHIYANEKYISLFKYSSLEELEATPIMDLVGRDSRDMFKKQLKSFNAGGQDSIDFPLSAKREDGSEFVSPVTLSPANYDGESCLQIILRSSSNSGEQTDETPADEHGSKRSRREFLKQLNQTINSVNDTDQSPALAYLSIENMDELLESTGLIAYEQLHDEITEFISRQVLDETCFCHFKDSTYTVLTHGPNKDELHQWAEKLWNQINDHHFEIDGKNLHVRSAIGVTRITDSNESIETLIQCAEQAAYTANAQEDGDTPVVVHEAVETADRSDSLAQLDDFKDAMTHQALFLMYEPVIGLRGIGGELYQLHSGILDGEGKEIYGESVQLLAEEAGWRAKFDRWNILNGIKSLSAHISNGHETALFISLSHHSICDESLIPWIGVALKAAAIPNDSIIFQLTENDSATYLKQVQVFLEGIKKINCRAAISNFGVSRDPLRTLKHLDADYVIMDRMFTDDFEPNKENFGELVGALQAEGKLIMVPGIDSPGFVSKLWQLGINYIQGPYLQEPSSKMDYEFDLEAG